MTISIWRYSHLILALSSAIFVFVASVTGAILAFEPISNQLYDYQVQDAQKLSVAETLVALEQEYDEVVSIEVDENGFVKASVVTKSGKAKTFYVDPFTGKKLGDLIQKAPLFEFATNLHRSLFLKSTGRFIIGFVSLLLCLIAITGMQLIAKRQGGIKRWFSKVINENFEQYYHVVLGRYALLPILIITVTGVFLSLERFSVLPDADLQHEVLVMDPIEKSISIDQFEVFKTTTLNEVERLEFPFSDDEEDYFILKLVDRELWIHQYTGSIISKAEVPILSMLLRWSIVLHTGHGTMVWALVLLLSCIGILFFMYSGFAMTLNRRKSSKKLKNVYTEDEAEYILLYGSETGSTYSFAKQFYEALIEKKQKVYMDDLNNYTLYQNAKQLIVFTATYGEGESPTNAKRFEVHLKNVKQDHDINYAVLGFGSLMYPDYCKYAIDVEALLSKAHNFTSILPLFKINNQSAEAFKDWVNQWRDATQIDVKVKLPRPKVNFKSLKPFDVINTTAVNIDNTFVIRLQPKRKVKFTSGDLLAIYPEADGIERLYSIAKIKNDIVLSVKKHDLGVCSKYLSTLKPNDMIKAKIKRNPNFHFPRHAKEVIMISNGTGIAPFLGMINDNTHNVKTHLFWGGRAQESLVLYSKIIDIAFESKKLSSFHIAYSQEQEDKVYVQDLISEHATLVAEVLSNDGVIMICGAIAMQNRVLEIVERITLSVLNEPLSTFENNEQIKMDCY